MKTELFSTFLTFASTDLETVINRFSTRIVLVAALSLVVLVLLAMYLNKRKSKLKPYLFVPIVIITAVTTFAISGATVYLNVKSDTGGPVHWHADMEFWACGSQMELRDPQGALSNKIGSPTLHEHNDQRIHLEGVPVELPEDASVGKFMKVIGGEISAQSLAMPLNSDKLFVDSHENNSEQLAPHISEGEDGKFLKLINGQSCGEEIGEVQMFAYKYDEASKTYSQTKIADPAMYQISGHSEVPPGDCLIVEFGPTRDRTDHLCQQYGIRDIDRCEQYGVKPDERDICTIREVQKGEQ